MTPSRMAPAHGVSRLVYRLDLVFNGHRKLHPPTGDWTWVRTGGAAGLRGVRVDVRLGVLGVVDIDDDHVLRVAEEQPDAGQAVFDEVRLREAARLEQVPHPLLSLNLLSEGCHAGRIVRSPATDQDTVVPTLCQHWRAFVETVGARSGDLVSASSPAMADVCAVSGASCAVYGVSRAPDKGSGDLVPTDQPIPRGKRSGRETDVREMSMALSEGQLRGAVARSQHGTVDSAMADIVLSDGRL